MNKVVTVLVESNTIKRFCDGNGCPQELPAQVSTSFDTPGFVEFGDTNYKHKRYDLCDNCMKKLMAMLKTTD